MYVKIGFNKSEGINDLNVAIGLFVNLHIKVVIVFIKEIKKKAGKRRKKHDKEKYFPRLFYLMMHNLNLYFSQTDNLVSNHQTKDTDTKTEIQLANEESYAKLLFIGINQLAEVYNKLFWNESLQQNSQYNRETKLHFRALLIGSIILLLLCLFILTRVFKLFYSHEVQNENLALLGIRDAETGLFNKKSFKVMGVKELDRSKRRGYHFSLLMIKVDPIRQIKADFGAKPLENLLFQVTQALKNSFRTYDGIYKYNINTFIVILSETDFRAISPIVKRFKNKLVKTAFLINGHHKKVVPQVSMGFAVYPTDGDKLDDLVQYATANLTDNFEAYVSHNHPVKIEEQDDAFWESWEDEEFEDSQPVEATKILKKAAQKSVKKSPPLDEVSIEEEIPEQDVEEITEKTKLGQKKAKQAKLSAEKKPETVAQEPKTVTTEAPQKVAEKIRNEEISEITNAVSDIIKRYAEQGKQATPTEDVAQQAQSKDTTPEPVRESEDIPDVVAALTQEERSNENLPQEKEEDRAQNDDRSTEDEGRIADFKVVHQDDNEDVIMVDFDHENNDLAQRFRKKQKDGKKFR